MYTNELVVLAQKEELKTSAIKFRDYFRPPFTVRVASVKTQPEPVDRAVDECVF